MGDKQQTWTESTGPQSSCLRVAQMIEAHSGVLAKTSCTSMLSTSLLFTSSVHDQILSKIPIEFTRKVRRLRGQRWQQSPRRRCRAPTQIDVSKPRYPFAQRLQNPVQTLSTSHFFVHDDPQLALDIQLRRVFEHPLCRATRVIAQPATQKNNVQADRAQAAACRSGESIIAISGVQVRTQFHNSDLDLQLSLRAWPASSAP